MAVATVWEEGYPPNDGATVVVWDGGACGLGSISQRSKYRSRRALAVSWGDGLCHQGFGGYETVTIIWAEGNAPKDGAIAGCGMAPRVDDRARSISHWFDCRRRRELTVSCAVGLILVGWVGGGGAPQLLARRSAIHTNLVDHERHCWSFQIYDVSTSFLRFAQVSAYSFSSSLIKVLPVPERTSCCVF